MKGQNFRSPTEVVFLQQLAPSMSELQKQWNWPCQTRPTKNQKSASVKSGVGKIDPVFWWSYPSAWLGDRFSPIFYRRWTRGVYSLTLKQFWILVMLKHFWKIRFGKKPMRSLQPACHHLFIIFTSSYKKIFKKSSPFWLKISVRAKLSLKPTSAKYYFFCWSLRYFLKI